MNVIHYYKTYLEFFFVFIRTFYMCHIDIFLSLKVISCMCIYTFLWILCYIQNCLILEADFSFDMKDCGNLIASLKLIYRVIYISIKNMTQLMTSKPPLHLQLRYYVDNLTIPTLIRQSKRFNKIVLFLCHTFKEKCSTFNTQIKYIIQNCHIGQIVPRVLLHLTQWQNLNTIVIIILAMNFLFHNYVFLYEFVMINF